MIRGVSGIRGDYSDTKIGAKFTNQNDFQFLVRRREIRAILLELDFKEVVATPSIKKRWAHTKRM